MGVYTVLLLCLVIGVANYPVFSYPADYQLGYSSGYPASYPKIQLTLYYESLCPGCGDFIVKQLRPAVHMMHDYITVKFVPFGHASSQPDGTFKNQHGPAEGLGNMIQLCALNAAPLNDIQKVDYIACEESTHAATRGDMSCVESHGIPTWRVAQMMQNGEGQNLMLEAESQTNFYHPQGIPFLTINGVPSEEGINNLQDVLQRMISESYQQGY